MNNIKENNTDSDDYSTIGRDLAKLRVQLNMTQQQFADTIHTSRITLNKIERASEISPDFAYRIYYVTSKVIGNIYISTPIREHALYLQKRVEQEVILTEKVDNSVTFNPIAYTSTGDESYT